MRKKANPDESTTYQSVDLHKILKTWWPLATSWLLMTVEMPLISAAMARLAFPEINLAAYGGVVFPISLIIESPIIMLLAVSTALSKDRDSYKKYVNSHLRQVAHLSFIS